MDWIMSAVEQKTFLSPPPDVGYPPAGVEHRGWILPDMKDRPVREGCWGSVLGGVLGCVAGR